MISLRDKREREREPRKDVVNAKTDSERMLLIQENNVHFEPQNIDCESVDSETVPT